MRAEVDYIAAGGNRHPSAADWTPGLLAFGAGNNIALWNPDDAGETGISALLVGHTDHVNVVRLYASTQESHIISGGADKTIRIWTRTHQADAPYEQQQCLTEHESSINTISVLPKYDLFVTGSADGTLKTWHLLQSGVKLVQSISLKPRYLPLATAIAPLADDAIVLAVAGTSSSIQLFVRPNAGADFTLQATLTGHEGWIRSLDFTLLDDGDLLLASGSQDKYIRLWRFHKGADTTEILSNGFAHPAVATTKTSLSNKAREIGSPGLKYSVTFEALLIGHEDWIYTAKWAPRKAGDNAPTLLSASADNSLAIWSADEGSGVWVCAARLGEISGQKGSTTATGSTGGFWIGLWHPDGTTVASLSRTGSWRRWSHEQFGDMWNQQIGIGGHTQEGQSLAWAPDGSYLLTTSSDQTTRLFAEWKRDGRRSWHEFTRPQIHGYDLNCIDSLGVNQFISGADEKLLRVFNKPKAIDNLVSKLSGTAPTVTAGLADAANIPVLGLSNKAIAAVADDEPANGVVNGSDEPRDAIDPASVVYKSTLDLVHPPLEDHLARHTLWPEHEKLYGHGYEISAVAAGHDGSLVATACKASSIDHAVIRIYETKEWREVKPPLTAHSLTVTSLAFSPDDRFLLSVGRDRQWAIFARGEDGSTEQSQYSLVTSNPKGHTRMILSCSWAPLEFGYVFATAGRDKTVKVWRLDQGKASGKTVITAGSPVTAVAFAPNTDTMGICLAAGTEDGFIQLTTLDPTSLDTVTSTPLARSICPSAAVTSLQWRPVNASAGSTFKQLAVASDDTSIRILNVTD